MNIPAIFDEALIRQRHHRFASRFREVNYLHRYAAQLLHERLEEDIALEFERVAELSPRGDNIHRYFPERDVLEVTMDAQIQPQTDAAYDLILSNLQMHHVNDLPGLLVKLKNCLAEKGLMMATLFGGQTLKELRDTVEAVETSLRGGVGPRVHPFAEVKELGMLLQRVGYYLPVADTELLTVQYGSAFDLIRDLHLMGESNALVKRPKQFMSRGMLEAMVTYYDSHYKEPGGQVQATFEIVTLTGWKS